MASHNSSDLDVTTILAALRLHRRKPQGGTARRPGTGHGIGTNARRQAGVAAPGLDELCTCLDRGEAHDRRRFLVVPADLVPAAPVSGRARGTLPTSWSAPSRRIAWPAAGRAGSR